MLSLGYKTENDSYYTSEKCPRTTSAKAIKDNPHSLIRNHSSHARITKKKIKKSESSSDIVAQKCI